MKQLTKKYNDLVKIYRRLTAVIEKYEEVLMDESADFETTEDIRYSLIKRFELTYDLVWKYLREYMIAMQGITVNSPHKVFQQCLSLGIINELENGQLVDLIQDRNLTTHAYDGDVASKVASDIQKHHEVIGTVIKKVSLEAIKK